MAQGVLLVCGLLIGPCYVLLYVLGGALRPGYNHVSNSVSELLSPGATHKPALATLQVVYALLHAAFGLGVLAASRQGPSIGAVGAWTIFAVGVATLGTAVFPQDAESTPATRPGQIHKALVFGILVPASVLSTLLLGLWSRQAGVLPGFDIYSYVTAGAIVVMGAVGGAAARTRFAGLAERIAAAVTHQWLLVLALCLLLGR